MLGHLILLALLGFIGGWIVHPSLFLLFVLAAGLGLLLCAIWLWWLATGRIGLFGRDPRF